MADSSDEDDACVMGTASSPYVNTPTDAGGASQRSVLMDPITDDDICGFCGECSREFRIPATRFRRNLCALAQSDDKVPSCLHIPVQSYTSIPLIRAPYI